MPRWLFCSSECYEGRTLPCRNGSVGSSEVVVFYVEVGHVRRLAGVAETESLSGEKRSDPEGRSLLIHSAFERLFNPNENGHLKTGCPFSHVTTARTD